ncbi:MAG: hypothetical protein KGI70_01165 [Patescibacteria group bacterium]|nr:hypothetical protein [Patescibacteria group bacterium]
MTFKENLLRVVAVIGLLAVILLGAWGIIQIGLALPGFFAGLGGSSSPASAAKESLVMSLPASVQAGSTFNINWHHSGEQGAYSYALSYSCASGVSFKAPVPTGGSQAVKCDTPFNYIQASTSMPLTAVYTGASPASVTFTVAAIRLDTGTVSATATGATNVSAAPKKTPTPAKSTSYSSGLYTASSHTTNLYGYPDLAVQITSAQSTAGNVTVHFVVSNIGTNAVDNWSFVANLPVVVNGSMQYPSGPQRTLYPGDKIAFTLSYSGAVQNQYPYNQYQSGYPAYYNQGFPYNNNTYTGDCTNATYFPCSQTYYYGGPGTCNMYGPCNTVPAYLYGYPQNGYGYNQPQTINITVDPYNQVPEANKVNNTASATYIAY